MSKSKEVIVMKSPKSKSADPEPETMEKSVIILPVLEDSVVGLGDLWDCRTSKTQGNIFGKPFEKGHLEAFPIQSLEYMLHQSKNTQDRMTAMDVSASVSLEIAGLLKIAGSAKFDKKDTKKFNEEELICTYKCSTYLVRVRPSAEVLIDQVVKERIMDGSLSATHFVQAVRLGGQATGNIRFSQNITKANLTIGGSFEGSLTLGPVSASAKVSLEMLDKEYSETYNTDVTVTSRPRFEKSPTNVKQMFEEVDNIDKKVEAEKHFIDTLGDRVVGVPLSFQLVPLRNLFEYDDSALFRLMSESIMNDFTSMIYICMDFQLPDFIKGLIIEKEPRLVTILRDEFNPFTMKVSELERECDIKAKAIKAKAFEIYALYKKGEKDINHILEIIREYDKDFDIIQLRADIEEMVREGKQELNGIHASDAVNLGSDEAPVVKFFTNEVDLEDWWTAERSIKILLQTSLQGPSPSGTFLRLFNLSGPLSKLGVEVGIALPNISKDFSATFKIRDKLVIYKNEDIVFALDVLAVAIEEGNLMTSLFYRLTGVLTGLNLNSVLSNLPDITSLVNIFKESRDIIVSETYPQLISTLLETTGGVWNFVLPLQGINTSLQSMKFFRQMKESLPEEYPRLRHRWIVGHFAIKHYDGPVLFVFRDHELRAICLDRLDIMTLLYQFKISVTKPDLSLLSHTNMKVHCMYPSRANFAVKILEGLVLDHSTELTEPVPEIIPNFPTVENEDLLKALSVTRSAAQRNELELLNTISRFTIADLPDLQYKLSNFGWTDDGFLSMDGTEWEELHKALKKFLGDQAPYLVKVEGAIASLLELKPPVEDEEDKRLEKIIEIIKFITDFGVSGASVRRKVYKRRGTPIDEDVIFKDLKDEIDSFIDCSDVGVILRGILNAFERFYNEKVNESEDFFHLIHLTLLVEGLASEQKTFKPILVDIVEKFCGRPGLVNEVYPKFPNGLKKINDSIKERNLFKTLGHLSDFTQHPLIYYLSEEIYNLKSFANIEPIKAIIENMYKLEFSEKQLQEIWLNPKFLFLIRQGIPNQALVETIFLYLCLEEGKVPRFIPKDIEEKLLPLFYTMNEPKFDWLTQWNDLENVIQVFQIIATRKSIPSAFPSILRKTLEKNEKIRQAFAASGALFHWNEKENLLKQPWSLDNISSALALLMNGELPKKNSRQVSNLTLKSIQTSSPEPTKYPVIEAWKRFTISGFLDRIPDQLFMQISTLQRLPLVEYDELTKTTTQILPFVAQQVGKMHNAMVLYPNNVKKYIKYPPIDGKPIPGHIDFDAVGGAGKARTETGERFLMSKGDILTALFNCTDPILTHHLLCGLMKAPIALPLIIPRIVSDPQEAVAGDSYKFLKPSLQNLIVKELETLVPDPHLLNAPFRFVLAIRAGADMKGKLGKSTILNQLIMANNNTFSCFTEPGVEHGKPVSRTGLVEFTWLSRSTVSRDFYAEVVDKHYATSNQPDMVLLGNLHGDALALAPMLDLLKTFTSSFIVFWRANNWNELKTKKAELNSRIGTGSCVLDLVLYPDKTIIDHVGDHNIIGIANPEEVTSSKAKLYSVFREAVSAKPKILIGPMSRTPSDETSASTPEQGSGLFNFARRQYSKVPAGEIRINPLEDQETISCPESILLIEFIKQMSVQRVKESIVTGNPDQELLTSLREHFLALFELPLEKRNGALTHFTYELDYLSSKSSLLASERVLKLRQELETQTLKGLDEESTRELQDEIKSMMRRLEMTTLNIQDIFRYLINADELENVIHEKYLEYLNSGFPVELFQPTYGNTMWSYPLKAVLQAIPKDTRIFVLSMIGLKASGKSTLLNKLFGQGFREGLIGCTNGLLMRLLWVDETSKRILNCDAFLIIDSEGFGAPENFIDENADLNERNMASFILGISHLSIANILGDSLKELQEILEISFSTLARIKDLLITPDMLLVHQEVADPIEVTHTPVIPEFKEEWKSFMENVKSLTRESQMDIGVRLKAVYRLETVNQRFKHDELIHNIRPLRDNAELNSIGYDADIQNLYRRILHLCENSSGIVTLGNWYEFTENFWKSIQQIAVPNQFKNTTQAREAINVKRRETEIKRAIDLAFRSHDKIIDKEFSSKIQDFFDPDPTLREETDEVDPDLKLKQILNVVHSGLRQIINTCEENETGCDECLQAFTLRESLFEDLAPNRRAHFVTVETLTDYTNTVRESLWSRYKQRILALQIKKGMSAELAKVLEIILEETDDNREEAWVKFKQHISTLQTVVPATDYIDAEAAREYSTLPHIVNRLKVDDPLPNLEELIAFDIGHYNKAVESAVNSPKRETLTWDKNDWLVAKMEDAPGILLTDSGVDLYLVGMTRELVGKTNEMLDDFSDICREDLEPDFKWEVHLYAIKTLKKFMGKKQREWDDDNNPLVQLEKRKNEFPDLFIEY